MHQAEHAVVGGVALVVTSKRKFLKMALHSK
jgi:hypothetical protein